MKPPAFDYADPETLEEALALLADRGDDSLMLAGGQSLIPLLNLRLARPELVIDLRRVPGLTAWSLRDDALDVGAMVRLAELERSVAVANALPGLHRALGFVGHRQIRVRTTVGGSLAHADPAAELPAALCALDGVVRVMSRARGLREVPAHEFFDGAFSTNRQSDELVVGARFERLAARSTVVEVARRSGDFAMAGAFVAVGPALARVVLFGVADRPVRVGAAEEAVLAGAAPGEVASVVRLNVEPRTDVHTSAAYRRHLAGTVVARALKQLASRGERAA